MKFSVGDNIIMKHTADEGIVVGYINEQMVEVDVKGIVFPVYVDDLDHPYLKWFTSKSNKKKNSSLPPEIPVEKKSERTRKLPKGVYLSFFPVFVNDGFDEIADHLKVYLINEMPIDIKYGYNQSVLEKSVFKLEGSLHAFGNLYLHNIQYADMNDKPRFQWKVADAVNKGFETAEGALRIKPEKLFEHIDKALNNNEPSFSYLLIEDLLPEKKKEKIAPASNKPSPTTPEKKVALTTFRNLEQPKYELDLHIEKLVGNHRGMSNGEMMKIQLDTLERYLHLAIAHRQHSMIVIHGLGKGTLRDEVHKVLKQTSEVSRYKNEWSARYGFGATEVIFHY